MFDKLVESSKYKQGRRSKRFFVVTTLIYTVALISLGVMTIIGFSPVLAESYAVIARLIPPPPPPGRSLPSPKPKQSNLKPAPDPGFVTPIKVKEIPNPDELKDLNLGRSNHKLVVDGAPDLTSLGRGDDVPDSSSAKDVPPPPPAPTPTPALKTAPAPEPQSVRLTSQITQGNAIRKVQPPYPRMARQMRLSGAVQVQITISETGEVADAFVLSGHPVLREASLQAVRQWLFRPTELNGRPVRAIGVITFNFKLD